MNTLTIANLHATIENKEILKGIDLTIRSGEIHAIMGPNGSGKSTLAYALMGHPSYECKMLNAECIKCIMSINNKDISSLSPDERAREGLFLAFQNPLTVAGVSVVNLLRTAYKSVYPKDASLSPIEFNKMLIEKAKSVGLDASFLKRSINDGFSGGEKKKTEMLQALVLKPKFAIFDEIDTGLDIDALKNVATGIRLLADSGTGALVITHYQRILHHIKPDHVHVLMQGKIVKSGDYSLAERIEKEGYTSLNFKDQSSNVK